MLQLEKEEQPHLIVWLFLFFYNKRFFYQKNLYFCGVVIITIIYALLTLDRRLLSVDLKL